MNNPIDQKKNVTNLVTVRQLLADQHVFRVPDYQRGYAWNSEFLVMWQDILRLNRTSNRKHYTGMLALEDIDDDTIKENEAILGTKAFYVVDGQQRLTSIVIILRSLLSYIKDELPDQDLSTYEDLLVFSNIFRFGYSYKRQDGAAQYFEERIFNNNVGLSHADKYLSNINSAKELIDRELKRVSGTTALEILETILNRIVFNIYYVTDDFDVRVTFETINNRGKRLSKLELLKNRLMYLSTFFPPGDNKGLLLKNRISVAWQSIYKNLCYGEDQLSDDDYLKAHWIVYGRLNKRKGDAYIDDLLGTEFNVDKGVFYNLITDKDYEGAFNHVTRYVDSLSKYSLYWAFVNKPEDTQITLQNKEEVYWIKRLSRISNMMYLRAALMVVVAENTMTWADKSNYYSEVELFVFTNKLLAQDSNDLSFLVTSVRKMLSDDYSKTQAFKEAITDINTHDLHVDAQRIKKAIEAFKLNVLDKKNNYYYDWNGLPYFLYEYNDSLNIQNAAEIQWYKPSSTSIEHVLPQTPVSYYWETAFSGYGEEEKRVIVNSLGNLLLLSCGAENSSLKNYSFPVKKEMSVDSRKFAYIDGSRSAREIAQNDCWTINEVVQRTDKLIEFMYNHWFATKGIDPQDWASYASILRNSLPEPLNKADYKELRMKLLEIDTTDERAKADDAVKTKKPDYYQQKFLDYIDKDLMPIKYNSKKIYYKDWFTFKIVVQSDQPSRLECGVDVGGKSYRVRYKYVSNEIDVTLLTNNSEIYVSDEHSIPEKLTPFILSLYRYLRKEFGKTKPIWINRA